MQQSDRDWVSRVVECLDPPEPVYEFGFRQVDGEAEMYDLRPIFGRREYYGCDIKAGSGVDEIRDATATGLPDAVVGTIVAMSMLEHVPNTGAAVHEFHRVLRKDGLCLIAVPMNFGIHNAPHDYWRFTPYGVRYLLRDFAEVVIATSGMADHPATVYAVASKNSLPAAALGGHHPRSFRPGYATFVGTEMPLGQVWRVAMVHTLKTLLHCARLLRG